MSTADTMDVNHVLVEEQHFVDLLSQRRNRNDISWVMRTFRPRPAYNRCHSNIDPVIFRYKVLIDPSINKMIRESYPDESASYHFHRINDIVREIGCLKSLTVVRAIGFVLIKIMKKVMQSVFINEAKLLKIRSTIGKNPVVFVPNHRSYADFILMAFICFYYDIDIPVVVAAMDFHAMVGVASLLRQCGAMYMRRSFRNDRVYRAVFEKYVQTVLTEGHSPFEFFIEGTRSRCGKALMPKLGILKMIFEIFKKQMVDDITFVPISMNFDRSLEDSLFVREMIGIPKPKESTTGLFKGISLLEEQYGNIYINVGDEISLKELNTNCSDGDLLPLLAHTIVRKQQNNVVLTHFNILSAVIISRLMRENSNRLLVSSLIEDVTNLTNILIACGACINWTNNADELKRTLSIHKFLEFDENGEFIRLPVIVERELANRDAFNIAKTMILLQLYSNTCYHFIINQVILVVILRKEINLSTDELFLKYNLFRSLFKYDFVFHGTFASQDFSDACNTLRGMNVLETTCNNGFVLSDRLRCSDENVWFDLMLPYLQGYLFVYQSLSQLSTKMFDKSTLTTRIRKQLELKLEISDDLSLFYGLSSHLISCALSSLFDIGILRFEGSTENIMISSPDRLKAVESYLSYLIGTSNSPILQSVASSICKL